MKMVRLNDGRDLPALGFGTFKIPDDRATEAVGTALDVGYRLIDTAAIYGNEQGVGRGVDGHDEVWLTTKIWNDRQGHDEALAACEDSLHRLGRDTVDLLLIHWPCADKGCYLDTWKAFIELREAGKARSIGVSNFGEAELKRLADATGVVPALNQIECHPTFQQRALRAVHEEMGIATQSWSPLGQGAGLKRDAVTDIARDIGADPSAVVLAWHLARDLAPIPKASSRDHMSSNFAALDLHLNDEQLARIDALDDPDGRIGPDPATFC